jgi:hypothetical protein
MGWLAMQRFESWVQFECPACKNQVQTIVEVPEPNYAAEPGSDTTTDGEVSICCPDCSAELKGLAHSSPHYCTIALHDFPATNVDADPPKYSPDVDWIDYETPNDPHNEFIVSLAHTEGMLVEHGDKIGDGIHIANRMVFAARIGALEAYLSDTIINLVVASPPALSRLLTSNADFAREKFTLQQINANPDLVKSKVLSNLHELTWHNLPKVREIYKSVLKLDLFEILGRVDKDTILQAIEYRHDCVHRNGFNKNKELLDVFTKKYVTEIKQILERLVGKIEEEVSKQR